MLELNSYSEMEEIKYHVAPKKTRRIVSLAIVDGTNAEEYAL